MRSTITIDDNLFNDAAKVCGDKNISTVVTAALTDYVRRAAAKRLIALGGSAPHLSFPNNNRYSPNSPDLDEVSYLKASEDSSEYNA